MTDLTPTEAQRRTAEIWAHDWTKKGVSGVGYRWFRGDPGTPPGALFVEIQSPRTILEGANLDTDGKEV